jgi:hypothetical protein
VSTVAAIATAGVCVSAFGTCPTVAGSTSDGKGPSAISAVPTVLPLAVLVKTVTAAAGDRDCNSTAAPGIRT